MNNTCRQSQTCYAYQGRVWATHCKPMLYAWDPTGRGECQARPGLGQAFNTRCETSRFLARKPGDLAYRWYGLKGSLPRYGWKQPTCPPHSVWRCVFPDGQEEAFNDNWLGYPTPGP